MALSVAVQMDPIDRISIAADSTFRLMEDARRAGITLHGAACSRVAMEVGDLTARVVCPGP